MRIRPLAALAAAASASSIAGLVALAQDVSLEATYGSVELELGFAEDPYEVHVLAGGPNAASNISPLCAGSIADAPDVELTYVGGATPLFISASSSGDVSLVVNLPDGSWVCDDDGAGDLNPGVTFEEPLSGVYDIWVGQLFADDDAEATVHISEFGYWVDEDAQAGVDIFAEPSFGAIDLASGFAEDPYRAEIISGGTQDASILGESCAGAIAKGPDFNLEYAAGDLPLYIFVASEADTTLVVNTPDGSWACDDDGAGAGLNPGVAFEEPSSGLYNIWVGSYDVEELAAAELFISENGFLSPDE